MKRFQFELMGKCLDILLEGTTISLWLEGCLRKERLLGAAEPVYLWTNVELLWEEHRLVEVRYWESNDRLLITINGQDIRSMEAVLVRCGSFEGGQQ